MQNLQKLDVAIVNNSSLSQRVELFNHQNSQTKIYNPACNDAHPLVGLAATVVLVPGTNTYAYLTSLGQSSAFTDPTAPIIPVNVPNIVAWDENGNLVYTPGFTNSVANGGGGTTVVSCSKSNYRHLFETMGSASMIIVSIRLTVTTTILSQIGESFVYVKGNVVGESGQTQISADTFKTENQQQPNIVTVPLNLPINPKTGLWYNMLGAGVDGGGFAIPNRVNLSIFFVPKSQAMLDILG
jgi:hypothetical protein